MANIWDERILQSMDETARIGEKIRGMKYYTHITEIRNANERAGGYFFSDGAMRFFKSRIYDDVYQGQFFITSEKPPHAPRVYKVRGIDEHGRIYSVSGWLDTLREARREASRVHEWSNPA